MCQYTAATSGALTNHIERIHGITPNIKSDDFETYHLQESGSNIEQLSKELYNHSSLYSLGFATKSAIPAIFPLIFNDFR